MNHLPYTIPNNKEITIFLEKFAQNSIYLNEEKINLLKYSLDLKYQKIIDEFSPYLNYRIEFYKKNLKQNQEEKNVEIQPIVPRSLYMNTSQNLVENINSPPNTSNLLKKRKSKFDIECSSSEEKKESSRKISIKIEDKSLETIPVGIMASYIKYIKSNNSIDPYAPLDQVIKDNEIVVEINEEKLKEKITSFYQFYSNIKKEKKEEGPADQDIRKHEESIMRKNRESSESYSSSDSSDRNRKKKSKKLDKIKNKDKTRNSESKFQRDYTYEKKDNLISKYNTGYNDNFDWTKSSTQHKKPVDIFENFRSNKSQSYNISSIDRNSREEVQICYKCYYPGHIAKDCKYGLN